MEISKIMLEEHKRIGEMLDSLEKALERHGDVKEKFSKFKWTLEKHFFVEEKAIFSAFVTGEEVDDIFKLMNEHGEIIKLINRVEKELDSDNLDLAELRVSLIAHANFENEIFYPKLDDLLTETQKKEISEKAKDIIKG